MTFYIRMDDAMVVEGDQVSVPARPLQRVILTTAHARRFAEIMFGQLGQMPKEQESLIP